MDSLHRLLGRSPLAVNTAVKLRNQCQAVIGASLTVSSDVVSNGEAWLVSALGPSIRRFVDVGANVGNWTSLVLNAAPNAIGLCFEPGVCSIASLRERYGNDLRIELLPLAVGGKPGQMPFFELAGPSPLSSLVIDRTTAGLPSRLVEVTTLDRELSRRAWNHVDLVKIDAEGFDFDVIEGCAESLSARRISALQFEYNGRWASAGRTLTRALQFFEQLDYPCFLLAQHGLRSTRHDVLGEHFSYANYVALLPSVAERLARSSK